MQTFRNLVPDSALVQEAIELLRSSGGHAPAVEVADAVLQLPDLDPALAATLVADFIEGDWRLRVAEETLEVELLCEDDDCRQLGEADFVVFDVETTGPKTPPCRIMELGAIRVSRGRIVAEFQTLINPLMPIPPFIANLTGINETMVARAPTFDEVAADWLAFADQAVLVAHNATFDVRFINHELSLLYPGQRMSNPHLCTRVPRAVASGCAGCGLAIADCGLKYLLSIRLPQSATGPPARYCSLYCSPAFLLFNNARRTKITTMTPATLKPTVG
ncbi:MAG: hypothetical protein LC802_20465 [Acidobacteria bacterium]|nr:hypothetical protein [Acidobacteriota bacterium]